MAGVSEVFAGDKAEYTVKPQINEAKDTYGEELDKLNKVIQSVKTPEQLASAEKYADLMFKKIKKGVHATDTFGSGYERLLGIIKALEKDLAKKKKSLSAINEDCGMAHDENEEAEVGYVECPLCGDTLEAPEFYDHMMDKHKAVMRGPYDDAAEDEEISYEDEEAMNYKSSLNKGQHVEYNGQPHIVVVPDAQGDFVGIAPVGQEDDPDAVNLVHAREIMNSEEEEMVMDVRLEDEEINEEIKQKEFKNKGKSIKIPSGYKSVKKYLSVLQLNRKIAMDSRKDLVPQIDKDIEEAERFLGEAEDATVWDKAMTDKDESPENPKADDGKVTVPPKVKSALKKESKELRAAAEKVKVSDADRAEFYNNCAAAMEKLLGCLEYGTMEGVKKAQIHMTSLMSPIVQRIPDVAHDFITGGGEPTTLKNLFAKVKEKK
jgi:hypothetical protein